MNIKKIKAVPAKEPKTKESQKVALFLGIIIGVMAICQLVTAPKFMAIIMDFILFPSISDAAAFASTLIIFEILAMPFLFRLKLSNGFRVMSMIMGWLVSASWLVFGFWSWLSPVMQTTQSGLLGGVVPLLAGPWIVTLVGMLAVAMAWASWGLWPLRAPKKAKKSKATAKL